MGAPRSLAAAAWSIVIGTVLVSCVVTITMRGQTPPMRSASSIPSAAPGEAALDTPAWGPWLEPDAPFFSSVVDARDAGAGLPHENLAPRALVLPAGQGWWAAYDPDLLRMVAAWQGNGVTPTALAPGSYHASDRKTPGGQNALPTPDGDVRLATGIYPGWQTGNQPTFADPRTPAPSIEEVGRGPIDAADGRFEAIRLTASGVVLELHVAGVPVREWVTSLPATAGAPAALVRHVEIGPSSSTHWLVLGTVAAGIDVSMVGDSSAASPTIEQHPVGATGLTAHVVRVPPSADTRRFAVGVASDGARLVITATPAPTAPAAARWPQTVATRVHPSASTDASYVVDDVPLPVENPWRRNVRASDIQFLSDGTGVLVTLDGDVWLAHGLAASDGVVRWRRYASGLHEPLTAAIRDDEIYVFDRNGVWRLRDEDGDDEADRHELFSNAFAQTADTREFPSAIRLGPGGEFVIAKGGQEATTIGKHNGSVLRLSADGRSATVLGYGLRQPEIAVHPDTGLVTASDQQGHYIPSTPLHIVRDRQFYGFLSDKLPREVYPAPIADPLTWIPHSVNASAMSQVWLLDTKMGPLDGNLVHIGYNRPELFRVLLDLDRPIPQAAIVSITADFDYPPLNGAVNPADGQLYLAGFQIIGWGTTATRMTGLGRVRYTGRPVTLPRVVTPMREGVLLRFDVALDRAMAEDPSRYTLASWGYQRSYRYGSPRLAASGEPGTDVLVPSNAYLAPDGHSVFVAVPGMRPVMQLEVGWTIASADGVAVAGHAHTTPYTLEPFAPQAEGFGDLTIDLTPRAIARDSAADEPDVVSVAEGRRVYEQFGCMACHAVEREAANRLGPTLAGVYGTARPITDRQTPIVADEVYLRESIRQPASAIVEGYANSGVGMPSYAGVLTDAEIESLVLFIKSLGDP